MIKVEKKLIHTIGKQTTKKKKKSWTLECTERRTGREKIKQKETKTIINEMKIFKIICIN